MEYLSVNLNSSLSRPTKPTAAHAMAILCGLIILPTTPPTEFAAKNNASLMPSCCALTCWSVPKSRFELVSLPVMKTPSQPTMGLKKAKALPDSANARPSVSLIPLLREIKAKATTKPIVMQGIAISLSVSPSASSTTFNLMRKKSIVSTAASKIAVPPCKAMRLKAKSKFTAPPAAFWIADSIFLNTIVTCV